MPECAENKIFELKILAHSSKLDTEWTVNGMIIVIANNLL